MPLRPAALGVLLPFLLAGCAAHRPASLAPMETDRPDFTGAASTVAPGHVQAEAGYTLSGSGAAHEHAVGELLVRAGVHPAAELRLAANSYTVAIEGEERAAGLEDPSVGTKLRLRERARGMVPAVYFIAATSLPVGARSMTADRPEPEAKLIFGWEFPAKIAVGANLNWTYRWDGGSRWNQRASSVSVSRDIGRHFGGYLETFALEDQESERGERRYANGGLTFELGDALQLDTRVGAALARDFGRRYFTGVGIARRW